MANKKRKTFRKRHAVLTAEAGSFDASRERQLEKRIKYLESYLESRHQDKLTTLRPAIDRPLRRRRGESSSWGQFFLFLALTACLAVLAVWTLQLLKSNLGL
ncbi:MAG: hypothetical protein AAF555_08045 [Verrucomicrobiota bacterium]